MSRQDNRDIDSVNVLEDDDQVVASRAWHRSPQSLRSDANRTVRITVDKLATQIGSRKATTSTYGTVRLNTPSNDPVVYQKDEVDQLIGTYAFNFPSPLSQWIVNHNLNRFPDVTTVMLDGSERIGDVTYVSANQIVVDWNANYAGVAYLT